MPDYRSFYDANYVGAWDLAGKGDVVVEIARVEAGQLVAAGGRKSRKPIVYFKGTTKGFALNKTNGKTIAQMYGPDTTKWIGKRIAIFATKTEMAGETVDCIRVRQGIPSSKQKTQAPAQEPAPPPPETFPAEAEDKGDAPSEAELAAGEQGSNG